MHFAISLCVRRGASIVLYTMLHQGRQSLKSPLAKRAMVICPTTLAHNWAAECVLPSARDVRQGNAL